MSSKVKIRTPYDDGYVDPGISFVDINGEPEASLTVQSEKEACDINAIVEKHARTGLLPVMSQSPVFGDVSNAPSYQDACHIVMEAERLFMSLDAKVRREFDNDPGKFLAFVDDPKNADRLLELGLREAPKVQDKEPASQSSGSSESP